jgi:AAA+ superfamily predicted ATPase
MSNSAWFPIGYEIQPQILTGPVLFTATDYQIFKASGLANKVLISSKTLGTYWLGKGFLEEGQINFVLFGEKEFYVLTSDDRVLAPIDSCPRPMDKSEALGFAMALKRSRVKDSSVSLVDSIYVEKLAILLPVPGLEETLPDDLLVGRYLTGGVSVSCRSKRRLFSLIPGLTEDDLREISETIGISSVSEDAERLEISDKSKRKKFILIGRPQLETFFQEHVVEIIENEEQYRQLGVDFPSGIVLHGPPGCGKTFAVDALVAYLDWPCFTIESGSIGSPYIHETGRKISQIFDKAIQQAPSIIVIDEMEAFLSDRESVGQYRVEEVAEFLRRIPEASKKHVLVIAMTNRIDMIDPAILRRGRFDHVIAVNMPSEKEVASLLTRLLQERPCERDIDLSETIALLTGRPLSDLSFLIQEAARIAAKSRKNRIDFESINMALNLLQSQIGVDDKKRIGF